MKDYFISKRFWIRSKLVSDKVLDAYTLKLFDEAHCKPMCSFYQDRPCSACDSCPCYKGTVRLYKEKEIDGKIYYGFPANNPKTLKKLFHLDNYWKIPNLRPKIPFSQKDLKFTGELRTGQVVDGIQSANQVYLCNEWLKKKIGIIVAPARTGKCQTGDTLICTDSGIKTLKEVCSGLNVNESKAIDIKVQNKDNKYVRATLAHKRLSKTITIETALGYEVENTPEHPLFNGKEFVKTEDLKVGDSLLVKAGKNTKFLRDKATEQELAKTKRFVHSFYKRKTFIKEILEVRECCELFFKSITVAGKYIFLPKALEKQAQIYLSFLGQISDRNSKMTNELFQKLVSEIHPDLECGEYIDEHHMITCHCKKHNYTFNALPICILNATLNGSCMYCRLEGTPHYKDIQNYLPDKELFDKCLAKLKRNGYYTSNLIKFCRSTALVAVRCKKCKEVVVAPLKILSYTKHTCGRASFYNKINEKAHEVRKTKLSESFSKLRPKFSIKSLGDSWYLFKCRKCKLEKKLQEQYIANCCNKIHCIVCEPSLARCPVPAGQSYGVKEKNCMDKLEKILKLKLLRNIVLPNGKRPDGYNKKYKIIFEFNSAACHGSPELKDSKKLSKFYGIPYCELYNATIKREAFLRSQGYEVIAIWEDDYKKLMLNDKEFIQGIKNNVDAIKRKRNTR